MAHETNYFNHAGFTREMTRLSLSVADVSAALHYGSLGPVSSWRRGLGQPSFTRICLLIGMGFDPAKIVTRRGQKFLAPVAV